jgi:hypothetical protein
MQDPVSFAVVAGDGSGERIPEALAEQLRLFGEVLFCFVRRRPDIKSHGSPDAGWSEDLKHVFISMVIAQFDRAIEMDVCRRAQGVFLISGQPAEEVGDRCGFD